MKSTLAVIVFAASVGCGGGTPSPSSPSAPPPAAAATSPMPASAAPAETAGIDLSKLADLDDATLATVHLKLAFTGAPVGPSTQRWEYRIDGKSFEYAETGPGAQAGGAHSTGDALRQLAEALRRHGLAARPESPDPGCDGGSTYTLEITRGAESSTLRAYVCAGASSGTLDGDIAAFADDVKALYADPATQLPRP